MLRRYVAAVDVFAKEEELSVVPVVDVCEEFRTHVVVSLNLAYVSLLHELNVLSPINLTDEPSVTEASDVQLWNALQRISRTSSGITIDVNAAQHAKAYCFISISAADSVTLASFLQL